MSLQQWVNSQANPEVVVNENFDILAALAVYGRDPTTTTGLTWGYIGGRWSGFSVTAGTLTLTGSDVNYITVDRSDGAISTSIADTNWNDTDNHARVYQVTTGVSTVTSFEDHRMGAGGVFAGVASGGGGGSTTTAIPIACSDETTALTTGAAKVTFRMPFAMTLTGVRASVTTAPVGSVLTVDINEGGVSILSTLLTIDAGEKTSTTAATPAVISDTALADDAEITIDIDAVGSTTAGAGLKVYLIGTPA
jgi:hypothetical protein